MFTTTQCVLQYSVNFYQEGWALAGRSQPQNKQASTVERIQARVTRLEKSALAYEAFAIIQNGLVSNVLGSRASESVNLY